MADRDPGKAEGRSRPLSVTNRAIADDTDEGGSATDPPPACESDPRLAGGGA
jgi:hypothetical protein